MEKRNIVGADLADISGFVTGHGLPKYLAREIALWVYRRGAKSFDEMTNISKAARTLLDKHFIFKLSPPVKVQVSSDGTKKYLFSSLNNKFIETAYMPDKKRNTLCVSTQVGCKMGCRFCMTARQGLQGQLSAGDILNQILGLPEKDTLTNLVYMGMGEPFDNTDEVLKSLDIITSDYGMAISPRKITVSTIGLIPGMKRFIEHSKCNLAISMHSPFDEERKKLMPVQKLYPIDEIIQLLKASNFEKQRRISFEYILFKGLNDTDAHVKQLARILNGLRCKINLMHFHTIPGSSLTGCDDASIKSFQDKLNDKGIVATVRASRGEDILAACGMLSTGAILGSTAVPNNSPEPAN
ncbi:MAG: 23S rRNA (adenine(2503)-C(2))-methyltransferase RlmN [Bacteroidales bacterium]|nr:23S rRNA (adenine(2503)-C(2))-methyltransferase RlmN [Bacteroidales bacterium]